MKKSLLIVLILLCALPAEAVNNLLWDSEMAATWATEKAGNTTAYQRLVTETPSSGSNYSPCSTNVFGYGPAIRYKVEANATWATRAYNQIAPLISTSICDNDAVREHTVPLGIVYGMVGADLNQTQKDAIEVIMQRAHDKILAKSPWSGCGTAPWDSDQLIGAYFGLLMMAIASEPENPGRIDTWMNECETFPVSRCVGGLTATGSNTSTFRNTVYKYFTELATGGEWVESTLYNRGTLKLAFMGAEAARKYFGTDYFSEITALHDDFADHYYESTTPDYAMPFGWGDNQSPNRSHDDFRSAATYAMMANLDDNTNMWDLFDDVNSFTACQEPSKWFWYKPSSEAPRAKKSGVTDDNASGVGTAYWHSGWSNTDSMFASIYVNKVSVDHEMDGIHNWGIYRNQKWAVTAPEGYYGNRYSNSNYYNQVLLYGAASAMYEARGQIAYEAGSNYMYHAGTTGGLYDARGTDSPVGIFVKESTRQFFGTHNSDGSDTVVIHDRWDACNPSSTSCITTTQYNNWPSKNVIANNGLGKIYHDRITGVGSKHQWILNAYNTPTDNGSGNYSWTDPNGTTVYLKTFIPAYTYSLIDLPTTSLKTAPYYFDNTGGVEQGVSGTSYRRKQIRLQITPGTNGFEFQSFINVVHTGSSLPTLTQITDTGGTEDARGVLIDLSGAKKLVVFNDQRDTTTTFTSTIHGTVGCQGPPGNCANYDPDRLSKQEGMSRFDFGSSVQFTTSDTENIEIWLIGLDHNLSWTVTKNGSAAGCTVTDEDVCHFTLTGSVGTHTITWAAGGATPTCDTICNLCLAEGTCEASAATCYWHNNNGTTATQCNTNQDPLVLCAANPVQCTDQTMCENATWCWENGACQAECTVGNPAETVTVDINPSVDTYLRGGTSATTNFDTGGIFVKSASDANFVRVGLMKFDLTSIPSNATIESANIHGTVRLAGNTSSAIRVYKGLRNWVENQATYNVYSTGNSWTTAGASGNGTDVTGTVGSTSGMMASYAVTGGETVDQQIVFTGTASLVSYIQESLASSINLTMFQLTNGNANFAIQDSENATTTKRPFLRVTYSTPATTPGCEEDSGQCGDQIACEAAGWCWESAACVDVCTPTESCDSTHSSLCLNQVDCENASNCWEDNACIPECTVPEDVCDDTHPTLCTTLSDCVMANNCWEGNACVDNCTTGTSTVSKRVIKSGVITAGTIQ